MKEITCCFLFLSLTFYGFSQSAKSLENIQQRINEAQDQSFAQQKNLIAPVLEELSKNEAQPWLTYWKAYAAYQGSIYLMVSKDDAKAADVYIQKGLDALSARKELNSEEEALMGALYSFSISIKPGEAISLSGKARKHFNKALKSNPDNLRALFGLGRSDFYRPKEYGGGKEVEAYLLKALAAPDQLTEDANAPGWGRDEAYYYLASFYQREGRIDDAPIFAQGTISPISGYFTALYICCDLYFFYSTTLVV